MTGLLRKFIMLTQKNIDFERVRKAIAYFNENHKSQPTLDEVEKYVHLSPYHFHRMFSNWVGVSPKQFLRYTSITHALLDAICPFKKLVSL